VSDLQRGADRIQDLTAQLAAERAARQAEREAMERLTESQHRYVALVALRDQQIAALREGLESLVGNAGGYDMSIVRALCHQARAAGGNPSALNLVERVMAAEEKARALLAQPAGDQEGRMSDTWTPGYALNVLYSYAFDAPSTRRDPGLNDINMARDVLLVAIKQLAAERVARQAEAAE